MQVIAELNNYQRELLMRMYRSRLNEEVFPVTFDMTGIGEGLVRCGFIVNANGFYEFTDYGLNTWKAYGDSLNAVYMYHSKLSQEKRKQRRGEGKMKDKELSDWEKKAMETLSLTQWDALKMLYEAGADTVWVDAEINHVTRKTLVRYGFIEYDQHNNKYWLLDAGVQKLERVGETRNGAALDNEDSHVVVVEVSTPDVEPADELAHCDTCAECVEHEVLHMLMKKYPAVGRLRDAVLETRRLMKELGLNNE